MLELKTVSKSILLFYIVTAFITGLFIEYQFGNTLDYWIHDSASVFQHRTTWKYSGIVTLDEGVPFSVGRKQALPLFALATERLIEAGAKGVFLDARVSKEQEGRMPYARCIENDGRVQWSSPQCSVSAENQCQINYSALGSAPLKMDRGAISYFRIAPYLNDENDLPDFLLYDWDAADSIPSDGLEVSDRLVTYDSPIARWLDLSNDHAVFKLVEFIQPGNVIDLFQKQPSDQVCNSTFPCRRIRLSNPSYSIQTQGEQLILPVSVLASCDTQVAMNTATLLKDKVAVLQTSAPNESTDLVVTAMTTAIFSPKRMTPGAQYLIDGVETLLNQDAPRSPPYSITLLIYALVAIASVLASVFLRHVLVWLLGLAIFITLILLCFYNPVVQLWPVVSSMAVFLVGAGQMLFVHLVLGYKQGRLVRQYLPSQVYNILILLKKSENFKIRRCHVAVLMSDLAGYTTVTGLLKEPKLVLELMNDYLEETSYVIQKKYDGILESYVGDMVCYYWRQEAGQEPAEMYQKALSGAVELRMLQKQFFISLQQRYKDKIDAASLQQINSIIDAGIGITAGHVVMGNLGPKHGIKKFGILGDPLNLAARIESLTRLFNTEIIIAGDLLSVVEQSGLVSRRLGKVKVKGRIKPETLYALGRVDDPRFAVSNVKVWSNWLKQVESGATPSVLCPECYQKDQNTIQEWLKRQLLGEDGVWYLDEK